MNHKHNSGRTGRVGILLFVAFMSLFLASCLKNTSSDVNPPTALVTVIQASPDEPSLDFYLSGERVNSFPLTFGTGIDYFSAIAGTRTINFFQSGTTSPTVATAQITLTPNMAYSLFLDSSSTKPGILFLTDSLVKPAAGKAGVRFVNLSPDSPPVSLIIQGGATIATHKSFKGYTSFLPVTGKSNFTLQVVQTGTGIVLANLTGVSLTNGYLYTVMYEGFSLITDANAKPNVIMITNAYFN